MTGQYDKKTIWEADNMRACFLLYIHVIMSLYYQYLHYKQIGAFTFGSLVGFIFGWMVGFIFESTAGGYDVLWRQKY